MVTAENKHIDIEGYIGFMLSYTETNVDLYPSRDDGSVVSLYKEDLTKLINYLTEMRDKMKS